MRFSGMFHSFSFSIFVYVSLLFLLLDFLRTSRCWMRLLSVLVRFWYWEGDEDWCRMLVIEVESWMWLNVKIRVWRLKVAMKMKIILNVLIRFLDECDWRFWCVSVTVIKWRKWWVMSAYFIELWFSYEMTLKCSWNSQLVIKFIILLGLNKLVWVSWNCNSHEILMKFDWNEYLLIYFLQNVTQQENLC